MMTALKQRLVSDQVRKLVADVRAETAEEIAQAIEHAATQPGAHCRDPFCQDATSAWQAANDAAIARNHAGGTP